MLPVRPGRGGAIGEIPDAPYMECAGLKPDMAINGDRNKPFGPGGSTRRLHQSPSAEGFRRGRNRIDEGVKGLLFARHGSAVIGP